MCAGAILMSQLGKVVFGARDPRQGCCGSVYDLPSDPALGGRTRWVEDPSMQCIAILEVFFAQKREKSR